MTAAILLASFGGPESPDEVMPFLERVTAGRGVSRERLEEVAEHYYALGGVSPINAQNRALLAALAAELASRGVDVPVVLGNRNSPPFFADVLADLRADGVTSVVAIATSAYASYSGCRQYRENLAAAPTADAPPSVGITGGMSGIATSAGVSAATGAPADSAGLVTDAATGRLAIAKVAPYFWHDGFVAPFADGLRAALDDAAAQGIDPDRVAVLFSTHSIPLTMAHAAGPDERRTPALPGLYEREHLDVAERVLDVACGDGRRPPWSLVFTSRSGPPSVPWLEPDIADALRDAHASGAQHAIVVPIGFVSDHVEVVWDLDVEARDVADSLGLPMVRVATPGTDPRFVAALADIAEHALQSLATDAPPSVEIPGGMSGLATSRGASTATGGMCSATCCVNPRADLPVVPGIAS